jgi:LemA protein
MVFAWVLLIAVIVLIVWWVALYNALIGGRNNVKNAFSQIDIQLKRRFDLIPNLVETAKTYLKHERETLDAVMRARGNAVSVTQSAAADPSNAQALQNMTSANAALNQSLGRLFAVAEAYPDLKADQTIAQLSEELTSTENRVAFARQAYNDAAMSFNNRVGMFPSNVVAGMFGFRDVPMLEASESAEERKAVKVSF